MTLPPLAAYVPVTLLLVVTPGATTAVVIRNVLEGGRRGGVFTALGAALANSTHAAAAGLGLAILLSEVPALATAVRIVGGLYLAWLGLAAMRRARRPGPGIMGALDARRPDLARSAFRQGLTVNLLNPAIITFYLAVVPTFIPSGAGSSAFVLLSAIHVSLAFLCHVGWASAFDGLRRAGAGPRSLRLLEGLAGLALLWLAARTALSA